MKILVVGGGGRESAIATRLAASGPVCAFAPHANPTLVGVARETGGALAIGNPSDPVAVAAFAVKEKADLAFVSADAPLEAGVVDALMKAGIATVGPTREGARVEWDKHYATEIVRGVAPGILPHTWYVRDQAELARAMAEIRERQMDIVVKPQGLTGGKGVKVMGPHLPDLDAARRYACELLAADGSALLVEKVAGIEFTIMALTDGKHVVMAPYSYDHPYRDEGDVGPGTGGMGAFTSANGLFPFLGAADSRACESVMAATLERLHEDGRHFNGVLNGGFFATKRWIRFMEFNARFGDPEGMNIMLVMDTPLADVLRVMLEGSLASKSVSFSGQASVTKYLVSPDYARRPGRAYDFEIDVGAILRAGAEVFFGAAEAVSGAVYRSVGNSRCVAIGAVGRDVPAVSRIVENAIAECVRGPLEWRRDIGTSDYLGGMTL